MLINCPRCGFSQPSDRYCAQCGIDMENFKPPQTTFFRKIFLNPVSQIGFVLVLGLIVSVVVINRGSLGEPENIVQLKSISRMANMRAAQPVPIPAAETTASAPEPATTTSDEKTAAAIARLEESPPAAEIEKPEKAIASEATPPIEEPTTQPAAANAQSTTPSSRNEQQLILKMTAAEVSSRYLQVLFSEGRQSGQINSVGDYVAGLLPDFSKKMSRSSSDIKVLLREDRPIEFNKPLQFFQGSHGGDALAEVGFTYHIMISQGEQESIRAQIEIIRSAKSKAAPGAPPVQQKTPFPADFDLSEGGAFFMAGLIPRAGFGESDRELAAVRPFQILQSSGFRSQATEFVIFMEIDRMVDSNPK